MDWFPRRHAVVLARSSPSRLAYLEKLGIIVPQRSGGSSRLEVFYSWEQILEIRAISRLRQHLSFQTIRKILQYFDDRGVGRTLRDKHLVIGNHGVSWVRSGTTTPQVVHLVGHSCCPMGQFVLAPLNGPDLSCADALAKTTMSKVVDIEHFRQKARSR
ncbi:MULTISPECIES: MerR family transcriptional regulator [Cyanophyceae]|uniref:MerR family transcriptional regulator n=1 Tax=Leptolyngbya subtilissima DQ-A4 TaxID=2933933 RepID=A0ABV0K0D0_9CYAN|nr:MerR family transcriptional regulator [Nodosilinea sp. FACHB-141]MBD2112057.1 MerR family transcriptional regulator [Nodosilinea sp. FACHB-141]